MTFREAATHYYTTYDMNCAEAMLHGANDALSLGLTDNDYKLLGAYGGGCGSGSLCGAVAACVSVIGLVNIKDTAHESDATAKAGRFVREVRSRFGSELCASLRREFHTKEERCLATIQNVAQVLDDRRGELL